MANTVDVSARKFLGKIQMLSLVPDRAIETAHKVIMAEVPVYTETYQDSVVLEPAKKTTKDRMMARVFVSQQSLMQSALSHANAIALMAIPGTGMDAHVDPGEYITGVPRFIGERAYALDAGTQPYPIRIEAEGSPKTGMGQGMWAQASQVAGAVVREAMREAVV